MKQDPEATYIIDVKLEQKEKADAFLGFVDLLHKLGFVKSTKLERPEHSNVKRLYLEWKTEDTCKTT